MDDHNYRTRHSIQLIQCSFSLFSNSLDELWKIFFFDFPKGFYWKENLWTNITTVPVLVYTWFGANFLRCHILLMTIFFTSLRGFTGTNFLDNHNYRTRHCIHRKRGTGHGKKNVFNWSAVKKLRGEESEGLTSPRLANSRHDLAMSVTPLSLSRHWFKSATSTSLKRLYSAQARTLSERLARLYKALRSLMRARGRERERESEREGEGEGQRVFGSLYHTIFCIRSFI